MYKTTELTENALEAEFYSRNNGEKKAMSELTTVTLKYIKRNTTDKNGNALKNKFGPYTSVGIKTAEYGDRWLNGYGNRTTDKWNQGDQVQIHVEEKGQWLNFKTPSRKVSRDEFDDLVERVTNAANVMKEVIGRLAAIEDVLDYSISTGDLQDRPAINDEGEAEQIEFH